MINFLINSLGFSIIWFAISYHKALDPKSKQSNKEIFIWGAIIAFAGILISYNA